MLDEGYATGIDSIQLSPGQFPEYNTTDPAEGLMLLNKAMQAVGWRGVGLWNRM
jgi:hypothetical protein